MTDFTSAQHLFHKERPALVIHCAALSNSRHCQDNPAIARKINIDATACLAELSTGIPFLFFSTDLVFDGKAGNYKEEAPVNPLGVYAETKVAAETIVRTNPRHTVVRTSLNGGVSITHDRGFNEAARIAWEKQETLRLFTDEFRSPIHAAITANAVWELVKANATGLFHVAGSERLSRFQIGELLAPRRSQLNPKIEPATLKEYQGAPRAPDTSLNCSKAQARLSFQLPGLTDWLAAHPEENF